MRDEGSKIKADQEMREMSKKERINRGAEKVAAKRHMDDCQTEMCVSGTGVRGKKMVTSNITYIRLKTLLQPAHLTAPWPLLSVHAHYTDRSLCDHKADIWQLSNSVHSTLVQPTGVVTQCCCKGVTVFFSSGLKETTARQLI